MRVVELKDVGASRSLFNRGTVSMKPKNRFGPRGELRVDSHRVRQGPIDEGRGLIPPY